MKKRIISLLLVALMLVSIAPFGAMAAGIPGLDIGGKLNQVTITFETQPESKTVNAGEKVEFTAKAKIDLNLNIGVEIPTGTVISYLWVDTSELDSDSDLDIKKIPSLLKKAKSTSETYTIKNVTAEDNGMQLRCIAYILKFASWKVSDPATLTVTGGVTPSPDPNPDPTDTPAPSETTTPSPSPSVKPEDCTHANPEHHAATENNTCDPHIEYWYCPDCGKYFKDAGCTQRVTKGSLDDGMTKDKNKHTDLKKVPSKAATCTEEGNIEHWYCSGCGNYYSDFKGTAKTTHANVTTKSK